MVVQQAGEDKVDFLSGRYIRWIPGFMRAHLLRVGEQLEVRTLTRHSEPGWVELLHQMIDVHRPPKPTRPLAPVLDEVTPVSVALKVPSASELRREKQIAECRRTLESHAPRRFEDEGIHQRERKAMSERDPKYRKFVTSQPCVCQPCASKPEFHHMTGAPNYAPGERKPKQRVGIRGQSQKAADYYGLPLCPHHHGQRHRLKGYFDRWMRFDLRNWEMAEVESLRAKYERRKSRLIPHTGTVTVVRRSPAEVAADDFIRDNALSGQQIFDLRRLIALSRDEGRKERKQERP